MVKIFLFVVVVITGADKPAIYREEMPTAKDCSDAVTDLVTRPPVDFGGQQVVRLQASCVLEREDKQAGG